MSKQEQLEKDKNNDKNDIDYDSFIDVHEKEESSELGTAQLKSVQIIGSEDVPQSYLDSISHHNIPDSDKYYKFNAEIIGDKMSDNIEIYASSNSNKIDIMKDWSGVDFFKDLPYKEVPIKHISKNIYTVPNFSQLVNKNIKVSNIRELYESGYIEYAPRSKSWEINEFSTKDKIKSFIRDRLTTSLLITIYFTGMFTAIHTVGILFGITVLVVPLIYLHSSYDNIPRVKLNEIAN